MKIIYFTASGNCLAVAKRFDAEYLSIPQLEKEKQYSIKDDAVGIVVPVYGFAVPEPVKKYLEKVKIESEYTFVIATYGNIDGGVLNVVKKLLKSNNNHANYYETLLMVDNYLPGYEIKEQISMLEEKETEKNLQRIVNEVNNKTEKYPNKGFLWNTISSVMISVQERFIKNRAVNWFEVSDECIGCGICVSVCPSKNVTQTDKDKPVFYKNCDSCFACTHNCPQKAIHLKNEKSGERFRNPEVSLKEIIKSNNQE